jgi:hypothetical protein
VGDHVPELPADVEEVLASTIDSAMFELYKAGRQPVMPDQCRTATSRVWRLLYTWIVNNGGVVQLPADLAELEQHEAELEQRYFPSFTFSSVFRLLAVTDDGTTKLECRRCGDMFLSSGEPPGVCSKCGSRGTRAEGDR